MVEKDAIEPDVWSEWLLHRRQAGDAAFAGSVRASVGQYVDRVLDAAQLSPDMVLADIGTGEGVLALRAIERMGPGLRVLMTDISAALLQHAEAAAIERQVHRQCTFLRCPADELSGVASNSVDAVTTRAVLAYVADKPAALREFFRILKPGGRLSLAEPVMQDDALFASGLRAMIDTQGARGLSPVLQLIQRWKAAQYPDTPQKIAASPIANYSERTLYDATRGCGFTDVHLELHIDLVPSTVRTWDVFLSLAPHPWAPTLATILAEQFSVDERRVFEDAVRPIVESPSAVITTRVVYVSARKPTNDPHAARPIFSEFVS
jgi:arsenite methyltransferase